MRILRKILWLLVALPLAATLIALSVANRHAVVLKLDPFRPENPLITLNQPLYQYVLVALLAGIVVGGCATWMGQGKWRRRFRDRTREAYHWHSEAHKLHQQTRPSSAADKAPSSSQTRSGLPAPASGSRA